MNFCLPLEITHICEKNAIKLNFKYLKIWCNFLIKVNFKLKITTYLLVINEKPKEIMNYLMEGNENKNLF